MKEIMLVYFSYSRNRKVRDTFFDDIPGECSYLGAMSRLKPVILCHRYHYNLEFEKIQAPQIGFFRRVKISLILNLSPLLFLGEDFTEYPEGFNREAKGIEVKSKTYPVGDFKLKSEGQGPGMDFFGSPFLALAIPWGMGHV